MAGPSLGFPLARCSVQMRRCVCCMRWWWWTCRVENLSGANASRRVRRGPSAGKQSMAGQKHQARAAAAAAAVPSDFVPPACPTLRNTPRLPPSIASARTPPPLPSHSAGPHTTRRQHGRHPQRTCAAPRSRSEADTLRRPSPAAHQHQPFPPPVHRRSPCHDILHPDPPHLPRSWPSSPSTPRCSAASNPPRRPPPRPRPAPTPPPPATPPT